MAIFASVGIALGISTTMAAVGGVSLAAGVGASLLGGPKAPAPVDYVGAANAQGQNNIETARINARLNNANYVTPLGTSTVTYGGTPKFDEAGYNAAMANYNNPQDNSYQNSGYDEYGNYVGNGTTAMPTREQYTTSSGDPDQATITQTLTPEAQKALENNQKVAAGVSEVGLSALDAVKKGMSTPFSYTGSDIKTSLDPTTGKIQYGPAGNKYGLSSSVDAEKYGLSKGFDASGYKSKTELDLSGLAKMPVNAGMTAQNAIMYRLAPQIQKEKENLEQQLANQGVTRGSEAWNMAMRDQDQRQNDLLNSAALSGIDADEKARLQGFNEAKDVGSYYNNSVGQNFDRGLAANKESNSAIDQNFTRAYNAQNQRNASIGENFDRDVTSTNTNNVAQNQEFNQGLSGAEFGNTASNEAYTRAKDIYNTPLNNLTALESGSAVSMPTFPGYSGVSAAPSPIFDATKAKAASDLSLYGTKVAQNNATTSGLFSLAGSAFGSGG